MQGLDAVQDINTGLVFIAILGLMIVYKLIDIGGKKALEWWDHRQGNGMQGSIKELTKAVKALEAAQSDVPPFPQCHYAPNHFDQVEEVWRKVNEIHDLQITQKDQINQGKFFCRMREPHLRTLERLEDDQAGRGKGRDR
jgi:hypothetical protein